MREASTAWLAIAPDQLSLYRPTTDTMPATAGRVVTYAKSFEGLLRPDASEEELGKQRHPASPLVRAHHAALVAVEGLVNGHYLAWRRGEPTPLRANLDAMYARWLALAEGERLALEWPVRPLVTARAIA